MVATARHQCLKASAKSHHLQQCATCSALWVWSRRLTTVSANPTRCKWFHHIRFGLWELRRLICLLKPSICLSVPLFQLSTLLRQCATPRSLAPKILSMKPQCFQLLDLQSAAATQRSDWTSAASQPRQRALLLLPDLLLMHRLIHNIFFQAASAAPYVFARLLRSSILKPASGCLFSSLGFVNCKRQPPPPRYALVDLPLFVVSTAQA
mmetsp:Transcript_3867/g.6230  ORF Transcript_3867/g.6230 Transcript_3867/m.6230 type:complete len:209 (+) Transcript_3867:548-1174(+)